MDARRAPGTAAASVTAGPTAAAVAESPDPATTEDYL